MSKPDVNWGLMDQPCGAGMQPGGQAGAEAGTHPGGHAPPEMAIGAGAE